MRRRLGRVKVVVVREEGNKARKGSKGDWLPLSFKISREEWVEEKRSPEPTTHPSAKGKGPGKQQEGPGLDCVELGLRLLCKPFGLRHCLPWLPGSDLDLPGPALLQFVGTRPTEVAQSRQRSPEEVMRDPVSSQYSSFLFWRMPIPELDLSELEGLGLSDTSTYKIEDSSVGKMTGQATGAEQEKSPDGDALLEYSTFNFWRAPIASIHSFELDLL
ncbi:protein AF1q isoform X2 [Vicugna pacos]|uniref:Protein AF1q n=1 Tax=Vicugna pacos TaxID=30538 RepID=A0ABM5C238_VICPA